MKFGKLNFYRALSNLAKWLVLGFCLSCHVTFAAVDIYSFQDPAKQQQFQQLLPKLRCLVCQNQDLADSNAALAKDLRGKVYQLVQQGHDDQYIIDYLTQRYGDFILFQPPVKRMTYVLWIGPFLIFVGAVMLLLNIIYRRQRRAVSQS